MPTADLGFGSGVAPSTIGNNAVTWQNLYRALGREILEGHSPLHLLDHPVHSHVAGSALQKSGRPWRSDVVCGILPAV